MNFKKLKRKLSAVLCSAMTVGGSSVSNRVAMAGEIKLQTKLNDIDTYDNQYFGPVGFCQSITEKCNAGKESGSVKSAKVTFDEGEEKEYEALMYKLALPKKKNENNNAKREVKLFLMPDIDGFGLSVKNNNGEDKFGILPLSYFAYRLHNADIEVGDLDLSVSFETMDKDLQNKLIVAVANILGGKIDARSGNEALERAYTTIDRVVPDEKVEEGDTGISNLCIRAFWDTNPNDGGLRELEQQPASEPQVQEHEEEIMIETEVESKDPKVLPEEEASDEQGSAPVSTPLSGSKQVPNKQKWSKGKHLAVWGSTGGVGLAAVTSPIWGRWIANRRNRSLLRNRRMMNNIGVPVRPNNGGVKSNGVSKGTRLRSRGRGKLPLKGNRTGKVKG